MSRDRPDPERLVDDLAVALCALPRLDDEGNCILALMEQGFRAAVIVKHFDEALSLARTVRTEFHNGVRSKHA